MIVNSRGLLNNNLKFDGVTIIIPFFDSPSSSFPYHSARSLALVVFATVVKLRSLHIGLYKVPSFSLQLAKFLGEREMNWNSHRILTLVPNAHIVSNLRPNMFAILFIKFITYYMKSMFLCLWKSLFSAQQFFKFKIPILD